MTTPVDDLKNAVSYRLAGMMSDSEWAQRANAATIQHLLDRLEVAERDAKRLDAMETMLRKTHYATYNKHGFAMQPRQINAEYCCYKTLREAIDAAMKENK